MRIGFTGTQKGMTDWQKDQFLYNIARLGCTEFVFGDCIGADIEAANLALDAGVRIFTIYPQNKDTKKRAYFFNSQKNTEIENEKWHQILASNKEVITIRWMRAEAPLERNLRIVDNCDYMIACPKEFEHTLRSGTWATIRYAWKKKKDKITIIPPVDR